MTDLQLTPDIDSLADRARSLGRLANLRAGKSRVELYVKASFRRRLERGSIGVAPLIAQVFESGIAVRAFPRRGDRAGFGASSGLTSEAVRWVVDTACSGRDRVTASTPSSSNLPAGDRWDLDRVPPPIDELALIESLANFPQVRWAEEGTTVEILVGLDGWLAGRRRHRFWACRDGGQTRLAAQRGTVGWDKLLDTLCAHQTSGLANGGGSERGLILTPDAAAPLVAALVARMHMSADGAGEALGAGWSLNDDPLRNDGLTGGSFDDAGFPSGLKPLAVDGIWVGQLNGPGHLRRASYREPPTDSATNLVMESQGATSQATHDLIATSCRVIKASDQLWVLELGSTESGAKNTGKRWLRINPEALVGSCSARLGAQVVTASGPIVPSLRFSGLLNQ